MLHNCLHNADEEHLTRFDIELAYLAVEKALNDARESALVLLNHLHQHYLPSRLTPYEEAFCIHSHSHYFCDNPVHSRIAVYSGFSSNILSQVQPNYALFIHV